MFEQDSGVQGECPAMEYYSLWDFRPNNMTNNIHKAEQFLEDLNKATIANLEYEVECKRFDEISDTLQEKYNKAMNNLGRWLVNIDLDTSS